MIFFELLYLLSAILLAAYGLNSIFHTGQYWRLRRRKAGSDSASESPQATPDRETPYDWPIVTVQLPVYNERHVAVRLIESVARCPGQWGGKERNRRVENRRLDAKHRNARGLPPSGRSDAWRSRSRRSGGLRCLPQ